MIKKRDVVQSTNELKSTFTNVEVPKEGDILLRSDQYLQIGCDLRNLTQLEQTLASCLDIRNCLILFTAEVSITYGISLVLLLSPSPWTLLFSVPPAFKYPRQLSSTSVVLAIVGMCNKKC
jgi:hypothetical protein